MLLSRLLLPSLPFLDALHSAYSPGKTCMLTTQNIFVYDSWRVQGCRRLWSLAWYGEQCSGTLGQATVVVAASCYWSIVFMASGRSSFEESSVEGSSKSLTRSWKTIRDAVRKRLEPKSRRGDRSMSGSLSEGTDDNPPLTGSPSTVKQRLAKGPFAALYKPRSSKDARCAPHFRSSTPAYCTCLG